MFLPAKLRDLTQTPKQEGHLLQRSLGSLGFCCCFAKVEYYAVTAAHVAFPSRGPSLEDISFATYNNRADVAMLGMTSATSHTFCSDSAKCHRRFEPCFNDIAFVPLALSELRAGDPVWKWGAQTDFTRGKLADPPRRTVDLKSIHGVDVLVATGENGKPFTNGGDSGALWFLVHGEDDDISLSPIGIHRAGTTNNSYASPMDNILLELFAKKMQRCLKCFQFLHWNSLTGTHADAVTLQHQEVVKWFCEEHKPLQDEAAPSEKQDSSSDAAEDVGSLI